MDFVASALVLIGGSSDQSKRRQMMSAGGWEIIYSDGSRSRTFANEGLAIEHLASRRDLTPDIKNIIGPNGEIIAKEAVWQRIKSLYDRGYTG